MSRQRPCLPVRSCRWLLPLLIAALPAVAQQKPTPQVGISPSRFELEIGARPTLESLRVINLGDQPLEIQVSVANWTMDEDSQVTVVAPTEQSLDQWMVINPLRFTIPPQQSQAVRFSIRPRVMPEPGEHRAMIYLNQILSEDSAGRGVRFRFQYGVAVYGYAGEIRRVGRLHGVEAKEGPRFDFDISSEGNAYVRMEGQWTLWPAGAYPGAERTERITGDEAPFPEAVIQAGDLPSLPVLAGTRRTLRLAPQVKLAPGSYVLDLNGILHDQAIDMGVPFAIPKPPEEAAER